MAVSKSFVVILKKNSRVCAVGPILPLVGAKLTPLGAIVEDVGEIVTDVGETVQNDIKWHTFGSFGPSLKLNFPTTTLIFIPFLSNVTATSKFRIRYAT